VLRRSLTMVKIGFFSYTGSSRRSYAVAATNF
jgi:hypothetical protein